MRVMARVRVDDERGANAVIVGILLVVLLGMLSLSVDGGFLFLKYRAMRNANDAAALAAALSCAQAKGQTDADAQADLLAGKNVIDAVRAEDPVYDPSCDAPAGTVTVHYKGEQKLFFSQVVGVSPQKTVSAIATAAWGAAGAVSRLSPLMLGMDRLSDCKIPFGPGLVEDETPCAFYWNNADLGNAGWGLMNLKEWDVSPTHSCNNAGFSSYQSWLENGYPGYLDLNWPDPTYVCRDSGFFGGALDEAIRKTIGDTLAFPVNDESQQLDRDGSVCPAPGCASPDKYDIIGFSWLEIIDLCKGTGGGQWNCVDPANAATACPGFLIDSNARCLITRWEGFTQTGLAPGGGQNFGIVSVSLTG